MELSVGNNILYIDSNEDFASRLIEFFLKNRFEVLWSKNKKDAIFKYQYYKPKVIICDIRVENENILNFLERVKKENSSISVIIITNDFNQDNLLKCMALNISNYIEKNSLSFNKILTLLEKEKKNYYGISISKHILGDGYIYNNDNKELYNKAGVLISLNNQERLLIELLLKNKNNFVPYDQIQNTISKNRDVSIDSLRTIVRHIRKKTYNDIIKNLSGYGYKINLFSGELFYQTELNEEKKIKNKRILIVEDSVELSNSLKFELKTFKLDCDSSLTFSDTREKLNQNSYDYILLDLHLPDKDGIELLNCIKDITSAKIIVLTIDSDAQLKEYLYLQGILDYVEKNHSVHYLAYTLYKTILNIEYNDTLNDVLVIDSSKIVCEHIRNLLKPRGYNLSFKYEIKEGLSLLKEQKFDLVIIDLDILGENCFEMLNKIKNIYKELPIMLLSSNKKSSTNRDAFKNGASEILSKPILSEEFILKVDFWIDYHRKVYQLKSQQQLLSEYKLIVDKASIVSKTNVEGIITYVNETFCKISGYTEDELLGNSHNIVRHDEMPVSMFEELWDCIKFKKQIWHGKIKNKSKDGSAYYVDSYVMPILDVNREIIEYIALRNFITEEEFYNYTNIKKN